MVEIDNGSTHTEIWYTQLGKTAFMNGGAEMYAYWPTPGGGSVLYNGNVNFMHKDWLGSARVISVVSSTPSILTDRALAPYGEVYDIFGSTMQRETMFGGGSTQDVISGMYDTPNRELQGSQQGRWLSPDPAGSGWNQYAYVTNPNSDIDPTGLLCASGAAYASESSNVSPSMWPSGCSQPNGGSGPLGGPNDSGCSIDGVDSSCTMVQEFLSSGTGGQCPSNDCRGVKLNSLGEFYRTAYDGNPDIFQFDNFGFYPTHWVNRYLGKAGDGLPSSVLCVYIGSVCDVPVSASGQQVFQGNQQLWHAANGTMNDLTAVYAVGAGFGVGAMVLTPAQALVGLLIAGQLGALINYAVGGDPEPEHNPNWPPEPGCVPNCDPEPPPIIYAP